MIWRSLLLGGAINLVTAATAAAAAAAQPAAGDCTIQSLIVGSGNQVSLNYSPAEPRVTETPFDLELQTTGCGRAVIPVAIDSLDEILANGSIILRSGSDSLEVVVARRAGGNSGGVISVQLDDEGRLATGQLAVFVRAGQAVPAGSYTATMTMRPLLQSGAGRAGAGAQTFTLSATVAPAIGLAAGSGMVIDLGEISAGRAAPESVRFRAYANVDYTLRFRADYGLRMRRVPTETEPNIPYVLLFDAGRLTQDGASQSFSNPGLAGFREHSLNAEVPALPLKPAGTYSDFVTVEISAVVAGSG